MKESLFVVGIFFGGILVGYFGRGSVVVPAPSIYPSNYDPTRAMVADVVKAAREETERCWKTAIDARQRAVEAHE